MVLTVLYDAGSAQNSTATHCEATGGEAASTMSASQEQPFLILGNNLLGEHLRNGRKK